MLNHFLRDLETIKQDNPVFPVYTTLRMQDASLVRDSTFGVSWCAHTRSPDCAHCQDLSQILTDMFGGYSKVYEAPNTLRHLRRGEVDKNDFSTYLQRNISRALTLAKSNRTGLQLYEALSSGLADHVYFNGNFPRTFEVVRAALATTHWKSIIGSLNKWNQLTPAEDEACAEYLYQVFAATKPIK